MERRWPLGLGLLLLLCATLTPGARAKEGTDPHPRPPGPAGPLLPEPAFLRRPLLAPRSCAISPPARRSTA